MMLDTAVTTVKNLVNFCTIPHFLFVANCLNTEFAIMLVIFQLDESVPLIKLTTFEIAVDLGGSFRIYATGVLTSAPKRVDSDLNSLACCGRFQRRRDSVYQI